MPTTEAGERADRGRTHSFQPSPAKADMLTAVLHHCPGHPRWRWLCMITGVIVPDGRDAGGHFRSERPRRRRGAAPAGPAAGAGHRRTVQVVPPVSPPTVTG